MQVKWDPSHLTVPRRIYNSLCVITMLLLPNAEAAPSTPTHVTPARRTGSMTPAERKAAARKLLQELNNDAEYQRSIEERLQDLETNVEDAIDKKGDEVKRHVTETVAKGMNANRDATNGLATEVASQTKSLKRVERMIALTSEGRAAQVAINLEERLREAEEETAELRARLKEQGERMHSSTPFAVGHNTPPSDGTNVGDGINLHPMEPHSMPGRGEEAGQQAVRRMRLANQKKLLEKREKEGKPWPASAPVSATSSGKPPRTPATTRRSARAAAMASARRAKRGSAAAGLAAEGSATPSTPVSKKSRTS